MAPFNPRNIFKKKPTAVAAPTQLSPVRFPFESSSTSTSSVPASPEAREEWKQNFFQKKMERLVDSIHHGLDIHQRSDKDIFYYLSKCDEYDVQIEMSDEPCEEAKKHLADLRGLCEDVLQMRDDRGIVIPNLGRYSKGHANALLCKIKLCMETVYPQETVLRYGEVVKRGVVEIHRPDPRALVQPQQAEIVDPSEDDDSYYEDEEDDTTGTAVDDTNVSAYSTRDAPKNGTSPPSSVQDTVLGSRTSEDNFQREQATHGSETMATLENEAQISITDWINGTSAWSVTAADEDEDEDDGYSSSVYSFDEVANANVGRGNSQKPLFTRDEI